MEKVLALDTDMQKLTDEQLKNKTKEFQDRVAGGESLDDLLRGFAVVREAAFRVLGMKHFPVQILGKLLLLHQGRIAEIEKPVKVKL